MVLSGALLDVIYQGLSSSENGLPMVAILKKVTGNITNAWM